MASGCEPIKRRCWYCPSLGLAMLEHTIELRANVELKDNIVAAMPKITGEGYYTCNIRVKYEWKTPRRACCKVFGHVLGECPNNIGVVATKNLKKTSQTPKGIPIGQKSLLMKVSKSNSFDELNSVDNDVELGTNGGSSHLANQEANYSGSSFWNAESSSPGTTLIFEKINKMENLIIDGNVILVDNEGNPLRKVDDDSEDEVALVDNEMASFLAKKDGYGTQSLLEQWKDSHELDDYEYDLYDDDLYEGQEFLEMLQTFCDNLDIKVRGRKKK
ncbi:hypothetical protein Tco_1488527 [Tanacetum coccineum]